MGFKTPRELWNPLSKAVHVSGKFHVSGGQSKRNCLLDRVYFHRSQAWQIVPIFNTAKYKQSISYHENGYHHHDTWTLQHQEFRSCNPINMMTSSNGNIFRVIGPLCGEFPSQSPVTRSFDVFFDQRLNKRLSKQSRRRWFETTSRSLWRHCNGIASGKLPSTVTWWPGPYISRCA